MIDMNADKLIAEFTSELQKYIKKADGIRTAGKTDGNAFGVFKHCKALYCFSDLTYHF